MPPNSSMRQLLSKGYHPINWWNYRCHDWSWSWTGIQARPVGFQPVRWCHRTSSIFIWRCCSMGKWKARKVILVREDTSPEDVDGMHKSQATIPTTSEAWPHTLPQPAVGVNAASWVAATSKSTTKVNHSKPRMATSSMKATDDFYRYQRSVYEGGQLFLTPPTSTISRTKIWWLVDKPRYWECAPMPIH